MRGWFGIVYGVLLRLLPQEMRRDYGADMRKLFAEREAEAASRGTGALISFRVRELLDLILTLARERGAEPPIILCKANQTSSLWRGIADDGAQAVRGLWRRPVVPLAVAAVLG